MLNEAQVGKADEALRVVHVLMGGEPRDYPGFLYLPPTRTQSGAARAARRMIRRLHLAHPGMVRWFRGGVTWGYSERRGCGVYSPFVAVDSWGDEKTWETPPVELFD
jgi:hypothetical protein